jgi:nitroreductase
MNRLPARSLLDVTEDPRDPPLGIQTRRPEARIDPQFLERWSPRAFSPEPIPREVLDSLFEAARWAPSSNNEQPWLFVWAASDEELARFRPLLVDGNRRWADRAPVIAFLFARRNSSRTGQPNRWAAFDAGAAWMSLALQARRQGIFTHAVGGFHEDRVYEALGVPREQYQAMTAIVIGRLGDRGSLPAPLVDREVPSARRPLSQVATRGFFQASREEG